MKKHDLKKTRLTLSRETLRSLGEPDLGAVAAGSHSECSDRCPIQPNPPFCSSSGET